MERFKSAEPPTDYTSQTMHLVTSNSKNHAMPEIKLTHDFDDIDSSPNIKPATVVHEVEDSSDVTDLENASRASDVTCQENIVGAENHLGTPIENKFIFNNKLLSCSNSMGSRGSLSYSDVSSDCSDLEEMYLEPENKLNITDIAFAEDSGLSYDIPLAAPTFDIDLSDDQPTTFFTPNNQTAVSSVNSQECRRTSEMREKLKPKQLKQTSHLTLKHTGIPKSHSSPALNEMGCFGFKGEDYYRNCAFIVAEAKEREKLRDYKGANEMLHNAVEILIAGVQHDPDPMRREGVRRRTAEYLQIAENFATQHRNQQQSRKPITMTLEQVKAFRVLSVKDRVMIVQSPNSGNLHVLKTLLKPRTCNISGQSLVVQCPFFVSLVKYCVAENNVYLLLKRVQGLELPLFMDRFKHTVPLPETLNASCKVSDLCVDITVPITATTANTSISTAPSSTTPPGLVPRNLVRKWAAQLVVCLSALHKQGLVYADLHPANVIIDDFTNVCVTYITQLPGLHHRVSNKAVTDMFVAPEVLTGLHAVTPAADWWSLGAVLFYLMSGHTLSHFYPYHAIRTTEIRVASEEHSGGSSLVAGLLKHQPAERLGAGVMGSEEIRSHHYFSSVKWEALEKQVGI